MASTAVAFNASGNLLGGDSRDFVAEDTDTDTGAVRVSAIRKAASTRGRKRAGATPRASAASPTARVHDDDALLPMGARFGGGGRRRHGAPVGQLQGLGVPAAAAPSGKRRRGVPNMGNRALNMALYTQMNPAAAGGMPVMHNFPGRSLGVVMDPVAALDASNGAGAGAGPESINADLPQSADEVAKLSMDKIVRYLMDYSSFPNRALMKGRAKNRLYTHLQSAGAFVPGTMTAPDSRHHGAGWVRRAYAAGHRTTALSGLAETDPTWASVQDMYDARQPSRATVDALADDPEAGLVFGASGRHTDAAREGVAKVERERQDAEAMMALQQEDLDYAERLVQEAEEAFYDAKRAWAERSNEAPSDVEGQVGADDDVGSDTDDDDDVEELRQAAIGARERMLAAMDATKRKERLLDGQRREVNRIAADVRNAAQRAARPRERTARMTRDQAAAQMGVLGGAPAGAFAAEAAAERSWGGSPWMEVHAQLVGAIQSAYQEVKAAIRGGYARTASGGTFELPSHEMCMSHEDLVTPFFKLVESVGTRDRTKAGRMPRSFDKSMHRNKVDVASMTNNFLDALAGV